MLIERQQKHLKDSTRRLADSLNKEEVRRLYFLVDDILQYGCQFAALEVHMELAKILRNS